MHGVYINIIIIIYNYNYNIIYISFDLHEVEPYICLVDANLHVLSAVHAHAYLPRQVH